DEQEAHLTVRAAAEHDPAGTRLTVGARRFAALGAAAGHENLEWEMRNAKWPEGASCFMSGHELALTFRISHSHFRIPVLEDAEREILPRICLNVGEQLAQLNHRERRFTV